VKEGESPLFLSQSLKPMNPIYKGEARSGKSEQEESNGKMNALAHSNRGHIQNSPQNIQQCDEV
jgi:hypothetical protein